MLLKSTPELRVFVFPPDVVQRRRVEPFTVIDTLGDLARPVAGGASSKFTGSSPTSNWYGMNNGLALNNVSFARFKPDGTVSYSLGEMGVGRSGFFATPTVQPYQCQIGGEGTDGGLDFEALEGTWSNVPQLRPSQNGGGPGIYNSGSEATFRAQSVQPIEANRGVVMNLNFSGLSRTGEIGVCAIGYDQDTQLVFRHDQPATIERKYYNDNGDAAWKTLKTFQGKCNLWGGQYKVGLKYIDGRHVVEVNDQAVWLHDATDPDKNGEITSKEWPSKAAPITLSLTNARARLEVAKLDHSAPGSVVRKIPLKQAPPNFERTSFAGGWQRQDTDIPVAVTTGDDHYTYSATVKPSADGISTPFLSYFMSSTEPQWAKLSLTGVNISKYVLSAEISLAAPPEQAGNEVTLEINRHKMTEQELIYLEDYRPVTVEARWRDENGDPVVTTHTDAFGWHRLFTGYIYGQTRTSAAFNDHVATLTLRGEIMRMSGKNGVIDASFRPLGMILIERMAAGARNGGYDDDGNPLPPAKPLYAGECIQEIVRRNNGPIAAGDINGNGNMRRFMPSTEIPLLDLTGVQGSFLPLSAALDLGAVSGNLDDSIPFPPPFDEDALGWAGKFCTDSSADLFEGKVTRTSWPHLMFGRFLQYTDTALYWDIHDAIGFTHHIPVEGAPYDTPNANDVNKLMSRLSRETRPESDINNWEARGSLPGYEGNPLAAAMTVRTSRITSDNINSDWYSWQRKEVIQTNVAAFPALAQSIADDQLAQAPAMKKYWLSLEFLGEGAMMTNDVLGPVMNSPGSDPSMNVDGRLFRISSVRHTISMEDDLAWVTSVDARPMSVTEETRFRHNNNLPVPGSFFQ